MPFPTGTCVKSMLQNAICPLRKCPPGNICYLRRKTNVPVQTSGKGWKCVGSFLPRIIGVGEGRTGGSSPQRCSVLTYCWQRLCKVKVPLLQWCQQEGCHVSGHWEEEKCVTLFTRSMPGAISVASNSPMSSKDRIRNQCFDPDISELFWLHTAPRFNFFKTFMSLPLLPDTLFVLIFSGIMSPCW